MLLPKKYSFKLVSNKTLFILAVFFVFGFNIAYASYERYAAGDTAVIGEFVYDDNFVATTTAGCTVSIYNPTGSLLVNTASMTATSSGWYSYNYSIPSSGPEGTWPAQMTCGSVPGGDLVKMDKSFTVGAVTVSSSTIATSVWSNTSRTLSSFGTLISDTVSGVWSAAARTLTGANLTSGSLATLSDLNTASSAIASNVNASTSVQLASAVSNINANTNTQSASTTAFISANTTSLTNTINSASSSLGTLVLANRSLISGLNNITAADVWSSPTRSLSTFGTLVSDIWSNPARTITGGAATTTLAAADVWTYAARTLTGANLTSGSLATLSDLNTASSAIASNVNASTSVQLASAVSNINANTNTQSASTTAFISANTTSLTNTINSASSSLGTLVLANRSLISGLNNITAADVWSSPTRSLSTFGTLVSDIWSNPARTITGGAATTTLAAADVWTYAARTLTGANLTSGSLATLSDLNTASSAIASNVNASTSVQLASAVSNINANTNTQSASTTAFISANTTSLTNTINSASSSLGTLVLANRSLISGLNNITAADVWSSPTRSLSTFGTLVSDIWSNPARTITGGAATTTLAAADVWTYAARTLTGANLTSGSLATLSDLNTASSAIASNVNASTSVQLASAVSNINANTNTQSASTTAFISANTTSLTNTINSASSSLGTLVLANRSLISGLNNITAADVWSSPTRSLSTFGTLVSDIWSNPARTITGGAATTTLAAADVWTYAARTLTGANLTSGSLATLSDLNTASSAIASNVNASTSVQLASAVSNINANTNTQSASTTAFISANTTSLTNTINSASSSLGTLVLANRSLISGLNNITAADVWSSPTRSLSTFGTLVSDIWSNPARTITGGAATTTLAAADVWTYAARTLTGANLTSGSLATLSDLNTASSAIASNVNASTSVQLASVSSSIANIPSAVWAFSSRTLSSFGSALNSLASDIWNSPTRTLTSLTLSSQSPWTVSVSDFGTIVAGGTYMSTVTTVYNGTLTDSANVPTVIVYDPSRNVVANSVAMTRVATGTYAYSYTTASNAPAGVWETVVSANVETGKTLPGNDYWNVTNSPAQVIINSISDDSVPSIASNVTITNEGLSGYEYQYEWCVVSDVNNSCGGGDDIFHGVAAKYINSGEDFNTTLTATVPSAGNYYFKLKVYFGTESSGASRSFTATQTADPGNPGGGGGGGGGAGGSSPAIIYTNNSTTTGQIGCRKADFNCDNKVNSIDFSILLYYWKTKPPFKNEYIDVNKDSKVDSTDFSILLYEWGKK